MECKTLHRLRVSPGDVLKCVTAPPNGVFTEGKSYEMTKKGLVCDIDIHQWTSVSTFIVVSRAPGTWGEMSPAEKGALLLAEYEGGNFTLQYRLDADDTWGEKHISDVFGDDVAYRIKPEPVVETVAICWRHDTPTTTRKIGTMQLKDGEPDLASIKMDADQ